MKQLKQSTINKYNEKQLSKHLDKYQSYHVYPILYRFNFQLDSIHKKESFSNFFQFYCNIKKYDRELIIEALTEIYNNSNK